MQSSFLDAPAAQAQSFTLDTVKSWQSFRDYLEDARKMWVISYCDSPRLLLELFDEFELEALELISGNVKDYRDRLTDEDTDLVDRLEHLKREGRLTIYTCPTKTVHSKVYLLEKADGTYRGMTGSANLTRNSWGNHTNHLAVFETPAGTEVHEAFRRDYELHRERVRRAISRRPHGATRRAGRGSCDGDRKLGGRPEQQPRRGGGGDHEARSAGHPAERRG